MRRKLGLEVGLALLGLLALLGRPMGVLAQGTPARVQRLLAVGDPVPATGRLGIFGADPADPDQGVSLIRRVGDDDTSFVRDYAGTALLGIGAAGPRILLDTAVRDPVDQAGLARILQVETNGSGTSAFAALRADNRRGLYRLEKGVLSRLALLPGAVGPTELAIGDAGQVAFIAPSAAGPLALFQATGSSVVELLRQGQALAGATVTAFSDLMANGASDLTLLVGMQRADGILIQGVLRRTARRGLEVVAQTGAGGSQVARDLQEGQSGRRPGRLARVDRPRIGPDGTVVFLGAGEGFVNFYLAAPGGAPQPMLMGRTWNADPDTFECEIAPNRAVALQTAPGNSNAAALYFRAPTGQLFEVVTAGQSLRPIGRPVFAPGQAESLFFFLARHLDLPRGRNNRAPVGLHRARFTGWQVVVESVATPGQSAPAVGGAAPRPGGRLLTVTQQPLVTAKAVRFGAMVGGTQRFPVPTARLFRVPLNGTLADGVSLAEEGVDLPGGERVAQIRSLSYTPDGALVFSGLLPGAGPVVATLSAGGAGVASGGSGGAARTASIASVARTQATPTPSVAPLLAIGQPLDRPDRRLLAILDPPIALGADRQLVVARFSQDSGLDGEGLFTISRDGRVQAVAATGDAVPTLAATHFDAFGDTDAYTLCPPAVSADGNVVFKTRLDQDGTPTYGVFQWMGAGVTAVGLSDPIPDNLALSAEDQPPYDLQRWTAGPAARAYLMERHQTHSAGEAVRLFQHAAAGPAPVVVPGVTPVIAPGQPTLGELSDYVLDGSGELYVQGSAAGVAGVFAAGSTALSPIAQQGQSIPKPAAGPSVQGLVFVSRFTLLPESARGTLLFTAEVAGANPARQGMFRFGPQGLETVMVEQLAVNGARDLTFGTLATSYPRQTANGASAFATRGSDGRWAIYRWRVGVTTLVAQEGQALPGGGAKVVSLDPGPVLDLPAGAGPVFTLNDAGDVAFLATDGLKWGIYLFSDHS